MLFKALPLMVLLLVMNGGMLMAVDTSNRQEIALSILNSIIPGYPLLLLQPALFYYKASNTNKNVSKTPNVGSLFYGACAYQGERPSMEDVVYAHEEDSLFGVYDGHGGSKAATFCAEAVGAFVSHGLQKAIQNGRIEQLLEAAFAYAERTFLEKARLERLSDGSCSVLALVKNSKLYIVNIGDCRAVLVSGNGSGGYKTDPISVDHKANDSEEQKRIEDSGGKVYWSGVWRTPGGLAVARALGDLPLKAEPYVIAKPDIFVRDITANDRFVLLASDGLWDVVSNEEAVEKLQKTLSSETSLKKAAAILAYEALKRGSKDNVSVIILKLHS